MASPVGISFLDHFAALRDPRQHGKVAYPLAEVLLVVLCGTLSGAGDFVEIRRRGRLHLDVPRRFLPFARGIPSHDTLNDSVNAIDGKTSRRTHDRARERNPLRLVSAWASRQRLVLGQQARAARFNEITAIPLLLDRLAIRGALVTIDSDLVARAVCSHGHVENRLHWVLDVVFHEDLSRRRSGHGPRNMATVRHIALTMLRSAAG